MNRSSLSVVFVVVLIATVMLPVSAQDSSETPEAVATVAGIGTAGPALRFPYVPEFDPVGSYSFSVLVGDEWQSIGAIEADAHMRPRKLDLTEWATGSILDLRIDRTGGGMAHVDALMVNGQPPLVDDARVTGKLGKLDYDVLDDSEVVGDWSFAITPGAKTLLEFTGRIEAESPSETPFLFPLGNMYSKIGVDSEFYSYTVGSQAGSLSVDGNISEERLGDPFFAEWFRVGTGHPQGSTHGWVFDDGQSLFVAIDFTSDNSMDGGADYAAVYVASADVPREYRVSTVETAWGRPGFGYTSRVPWEHKTYEFVIPLSDLDVASGESLQLAFAAYGTSAPLPLEWDFGWEPSIPPDPNGVEPNSGPSGQTFTFGVEYNDSLDLSPQSAQVWIDIDDDGVIDQPASEAGAGFLWGPSTPAGGAILGTVGLAAVALVLLKRRRLAAMVAIVAFSIGLASCGARPGVELFNLQLQSGTPITGAIYSTDVVVTADPGTYNFRFVFTENDGTPIPDTDTGIYGEASGWMTLDVTL